MEKESANFPGATTSTGRKMKKERDRNRAPPARRAANVVKDAVEGTELRRKGRGGRQLILPALPLDALHPFLSPTCPAPSRRPPRHPRPPARPRPRARARPAPGRTRRRRLPRRGRGCGRRLTFLVEKGEDGRANCVAIGGRAPLPRALRRRASPAPPEYFAHSAIRPAPSPSGAPARPPKRPPSAATSEDWAEGGAGGPPGGGSDVIKRRGEGWGVGSERARRRAATRNAPRSPGPVSYQPVGAHPSSVESSFSASDAAHAWSTPANPRTARAASTSAAPPAGATMTPATPTGR